MSTVFLLTPKVFQEIAQVCWARGYEANVTVINDPKSIINTEQTASRSHRCTVWTHRWTRPSFGRNIKPPRFSSRAALNVHIKNHSMWPQWLWPCDGSWCQMSQMRQKLLISGDFHTMVWKRKPSSELQFRRWKHFVEGSERRMLILAQADRRDTTTQITTSVVSRNSRSMVLQLKNTFGSTSDSQELGSETTAGAGLSED